MVASGAGDAGWVDGGVAEAGVVATADAGAGVTEVDGPGDAEGSVGTGAVDTAGKVTRAGLAQAAATSATAAMTPRHRGNRRRATGPSSIVAA